MNAFLARPIEGRWPYLWLDATYVKARDGGRVVTTACVLAVGVNEAGRRETTIERLIAELDAYIRWYNEKRIKVSLGALSPVEYRESLGIAA